MHTRMIGDRRVARMAGDVSLHLSVCMYVLVSEHLVDFTLVTNALGLLVLFGPLREVGVVDQAAEQR